MAFWPTAPATVWPLVRTKHSVLRPFGREAITTPDPVRKRRPSGCSRMIWTAEGSRRSRTRSLLGSLGGAMTQPVPRPALIAAAASDRANIRRSPQPGRAGLTPPMIQRASTILPDVAPWVTTLLACCLRLGGLASAHRHSMSGVRATAKRRKENAEKSTHLDGDYCLARTGRGPLAGRGTKFSICTSRGFGRGQGQEGESGSEKARGFCRGLGALG